jgi:hypothetical protein
MTQADRIRTHVLNEIIRPAREKGSTAITVRTGDIHNELDLSNAMPAVCSALGGRKFCDLAQVSIQDRRGPRAGSNVYITYDLNPAQLQQEVKKTKRRRPKRATRLIQAPLDFRDSLVLISCVKQKLEHSAPARELYTSPLFVGCRTIVEACQADWFVLSALHGLVDPKTVIDPYDLTLNSMKTADRREWAIRVLADLLPIASRYGRVVFFAGQRYREFLVGPIRESGIEVVIPMEGLTLGRQLSWLNRHAPIGNRDTEVPSQRLEDLRTFYTLLDKLAEKVGGPRRLGDLWPDLDIPERGLYFFFEPGEMRFKSGVGPKVVRVGTHALKEGAVSTLAGRIGQHKGSDNGGNHRGSIFRMLIGQALQARGDMELCRSWNIPGSIGSAARKLSLSPESIKEMERPIETAVSRYMADLRYLWLNVDDPPGPDSHRAFIERNSIALLSNVSKPAIDEASSTWLGQFSSRERVRRSGLWNNNHVNEEYDPTFLDVLHDRVGSTN